MSKQTIALACILKNEVKNLPRMLESVRGCFDEIHLTDTGSTDGSIELIQSYLVGANPADTRIFLHHFDWCDDFSAARNASFAPVKTDYIMWMDLDDVLSNRESFIDWKDCGMKLADFWLATYNYSLNPQGKSLCAFARERVIKNGLGLNWRYFVHEGILPESRVRPVGVCYAQTWAINHMRTEEDLKVDRNRNLKLFEKHQSKDARMTYYYGKELSENGKPLEGFQELMKAISDEKLAGHDRIMGIQYAAMSAMQLNQFEKAIQLAHQGLQIAPQRAEFFVIMGDSYIKLGKVAEAIPSFAAASACSFQGHASQQGPTFAHEDSYKHYPLNQLARIWANMGDLDRAEKMVNAALEHGPNPESIGILKDLQTVREKVTLLPVGERKKVTDIVITCPPTGLYEWDWNTYEQNGIGGSETAACEMAKWMNELTGRKVLIFAPRKDTAAFFNGGVEFRPAADAPEYFRFHSPVVHIAWRHCTKFSDDPMYVWCHDLAALGMEQGKFDHIFALSEFHKGFLKSMHGVADSKIIVTGNGIDPNRFPAKNHKKEIGKVVFSSSPDRGLESAIKIMDEVVKVTPATLHVYYGFENMRKMNMGSLADKLERMMAERPWVKYHGNVSQGDLTKEISSACVWLYPTNFLETYCITAIEMLCSGVFPVVRDWGALSNTLGSAAKQGMADLIDEDPGTEKGERAFAHSVLRAFEQHSWEKVNVDPNVFSWEYVARQWIDLFGIGKTDACVSV